MILFRQSNGGQTMMRKLHTVGYERASVEDFITTLRKAKVSCLIDVRAVPVSRKRGFS